MELVLRMRVAVYGKIQTAQQVDVARFLPTTESFLENHSRERKNVRIENADLPRVRMIVTSLATVRTFWSRSIRPVVALSRCHAWRDRLPGQGPVKAGRTAVIVR
jgi:hypothetical protein